ncbi:hypothetical protein [Actinomadura alba]|uniref:SWIM zinc finger family protein n=1 Tax=Actinomadura alba TaxID=406431 RepID=UPI0031CDFCDB
MSEAAGDRVRGFPAFPAGRRGPGRFARSWWGNAWIKAMRDTSLDEVPLRRGRGLAYAGRVGTITVSPGRIAATVYDEHDTLCHTVVFVEQLTGAEWERFLDQVAAKAGHIAALLDRDMPRELVAAAENAGMRLLPGMGDLEPECGCPGWEHPCEHAAALCYQVSWLLDEDPFVLLLMRGRGRLELMADLQRRTTGHGAAPVPAHGDGAPEAEATSAVPGVAATRAYARGVPRLPAPPPVPEAPGGGDGALSAAPVAPGVDPAALRLLVADAAVRAMELLTAAEPPPVLDLWQDTARMAATHRDPALAARLRTAAAADGTGRPGPTLDQAARAWRFGGRAGLAVLESSWNPPSRASRFAMDLARARAALSRARADGGAEPGPGETGESGEPADPNVWRNRWTVPAYGVQLRYGHDERWYPYRRESGDWWPAGVPGHDPAAVLGGLLGG